MAVDEKIDVCIKEKVTGYWRKVTGENILSYNIYIIKNTLFTDFVFKI